MYEEPRIEELLLPWGDVDFCHAVEKTISFADIDGCALIIFILYHLYIYIYGAKLFKMKLIFALNFRSSRNLCQRTNDFKLIDEEMRKWDCQVKVDVMDGSRYLLTGGWPSFREANEIEVGDVVCDALYPESNYK